MKAMLIKDGGRPERTEAAAPVIEPDDLRGNACRRSETAHDLLYSGKKHLKGERLFYKRFAFFRIKAHRNKNNTHTFVYAAKGCAMGGRLRRGAGVAGSDSLHIL